MQEVRGGGRYPMESRCDPHERQEADKLRKRQKVGSLSPEQKAELQAKHQAHIDDRTESRKAEIDMLVQKVRELGRYPKRPPRGKIDEKHAIDVCPAQQREWKLACDVFTARRSKHFSPEQEAELEALQQAEKQASEAAREVARIKAAEDLMQEVRNLGRYPKEGLTRPTDEIHLAEKLRKARSTKQISAEQEAELKALQQAEKDAKVAADIAEARDKPNPNEGFADEAHNKIDQDLMMLENGIRTRDLLRRLDKYKVLVSSPSAQHEEFAEEYAERVREALAMSAGKSRYVPGIEVDGSNLRSYSASPIITGPLVCQLCESDFLTEEDFARHKEHRHAGEAEYRKRVLYLMAEAGCRPITAQEKRVMVQNFAHFQQFCHPGSKANRFTGGEQVPRCEAACAICAQKDYLEQRHKLSLFGSLPQQHATEQCADAASDVGDVSEGEGEARAASSRTLLKHRGVYYLQSPEGVQKLLDVERYRQRWPLIPVDELHASSVQHPKHAEWRWLLHSRRVPVKVPVDPGTGVGSCGATQPADAGASAGSCGANQPADDSLPMKYYCKHCGNLAYSNDMPHGGFCCGQPVQDYFEASHSSSAAQPAQRPARLQQEQRAGKREAEKHEQEHERQEKRLRETQPDLDVDVCMYWQSVENLEVQKRQIAKHEKSASSKS